MFKKRTFRGAASMFLALCMMFSIFASTGVTAFADNEISVEISEGLDAVPDPIDPQSWKKQEDMLWAELLPNPVIDWMKELNEDGLINMKRNLPKEKIKGAIVLVDYWDRKFVTTEPLNSDLLGFYRYTEETGKREETVTKNPLLHVPPSEYRQWIADFLNINQDVNHNTSIDEYWRENSYGQWAIELDSYGPYTLDGFEFEFSPSYNTFADFPPAFRRGATGTSGSRNLVNESIALAMQNTVYLGDYDFFFILHAGYSESSTWYEFGMMQWATPADIPYEYGPGAKMEEIEKILTKNPEYLLNLETTNTSFTSGIPVINGYNQSTALRNAIAEVKERKAAGTLSEFKFKFPEADWDWQQNYIHGNSAPTRYVEWTSWIAAMSTWSSSSSATVPKSPENGGGNISIQFSQQGESNGMGTFAHEFGHIVSHTDNYEATQFTQTVSPKTDYWDLMARGDMIGPGGYHARWAIPGGLEASGAPGHMMMFPKDRSNYYNDGDLIEMTIAELKAGTPLVANVLSRTVPLNNNKVAENEYKGYYPWLEDYGLVAPNYYKGINLTFDAANPDKAELVTDGWSWTRFRAGKMGIEVVDRSGYDSFNSDHGVLLSRLQSGNNAQNRMLIDSHLYDIELVDHIFNGEPVLYTIGHGNQLNDALFHAGTSTTDTGYYKGSLTQWEDRNGRDIVSGNTVNEFYDFYNGVHVYILEKQLTQAKYGEFLSYEVAVLHDDGIAVGGELQITDGKLTTADPGKVAVMEYTVKNTGDATDIVRITLGGNLSWNTTLNNNLFSIGAGEEIVVPVYIEVPEFLNNVANQDLTFTASSESNPEKKAALTVENITDQAPNLMIQLKLDRVHLDSETYFNVETFLTKSIESNVVVLDYTFDQTKIAYANVTLAAGADLISWKTTDYGVQLMIMIQDYNMKDIAKVMFQAKEQLTATDDLFAVVGNFVVKGSDEKYVLTLSSNLDFDPPDYPPFDLIYLSNVIDAFGAKKSDADWANYKRYDFDNNGTINIMDVVFAASHI